jgi:MSHA biogenesis protein MshP
MRPDPLRASSRPTAGTQCGFSLASAIFLIVVLALLGAFIVTVTGLQQSSAQLDVQGVRAYQAARAGVEWAAYQVLQPDKTPAPASCAAEVPASCPAATTQLTSLGESLSPFTVTVQCTAINTTEGGRKVSVYQITATACNQPAGGSCLGTSPATGYVERQITATVGMCKDQSAAAPRCACG